jgi:hypothetical protein
MNSLTGKKERVAQGGESNHQYGPEDCNQVKTTSLLTDCKPTWMEGRRLAKRQACIPKPDLHHEPGYSLNRPPLRVGSESPEGKQQARETDGRNEHEKSKFNCHCTKRA